MVYERLCVRATEQAPYDGNEPRFAIRPVGHHPVVPPPTTVAPSVTRSPSSPRRGLIENNLTHSLSSRKEWSGVEVSVGVRLLAV